MDYINFFRFSSIGFGTTFAASPYIFEVALKEGRNDFDRHCYKFLLVGDYDYYCFPIVFRQYDGKRLRDFLDTGWPPVYLISDRVIALLEESEVTGWQNYPIKLYDKKGNIIDGYSGFSVIGKGGSFLKFWDYGYNIETNKQFIKKRGLYDLAQWDGSDIFMVSNDIIITPKVMKLMKSNKVSAVEFEMLSNLVDYIGEPRFSV